jgi:O-glycosyl hydrolase
MSTYNRPGFSRFSTRGNALCLPSRKNTLIGAGGALLAAILAGPVGAQTAGTVSVDVSTSNQTIRGFGGASAWMGAMTAAEMDTIFRNGPGQLGFTIDRVRIDPTEAWADEISNAQLATARGAIVFGHASGAERNHLCVHADRRRR